MTSSLPQHVDWLFPELTKRLPDGQRSVQGSLQFWNLAALPDDGVGLGSCCREPV